MTDDPRLSSVFVNCPFDTAYKPLFDALIFTLAHCGIQARSALEVVDSGEPRLTKIIALIAGAKFSIHDISRVELDADTKLPRFNMPIELGIAIGMKHLGMRKLRDHRLLVLDGARPDMRTERYRSQAFASDLAGVDISAHGGAVDALVAAVRGFLAPHSLCPVAGAAAIIGSLREFEAALPAMSHAAQQTIDTLSYTDRLRHIDAFIRRIVA